MPGDAGFKPVDYCGRRARANSCARSLSLYKAVGWTRTCAAPHCSRCERTTQKLSEILMYWCITYGGFHFVVAPPKHSSYFQIFYSKPSRYWDPHDLGNPHMSPHAPWPPVLWVIFQACGTGFSQQHGITGFPSMVYWLWIKI